MTTGETPLSISPSDSDPGTDLFPRDEIDPTAATERTDLHDEDEVDEVDEADAREDHQLAESPRRKRLSRNWMPSSTVICRIRFLHTCNILIMMDDVR